ncbi:MAG: hypothetical protein CMJ53_05210 [Planctomycetaceae bacterium]|nr:hypothetical protein [Planctomycetaceae bacterium]
MNPESSPRRASRKSGQKANPLAVFGVVLIVLFSILLGVLGPRVTDYRRGQFVSGQPVADLLEGIPSVYSRTLQKMARSVRRSSSRPAPVSDDALERLVRDRFGSVDPPFLPRSSTFEILAVDDNVDLTALRRSDESSESGFSVFYLPGENDSGAGDGVVLLVQSLAENPQVIYLRDEFGTPRTLEEGAIHRDLVDVIGAQLSLAFWVVDGFFYVLAASDPERLDDYLDALDLAPAIEEPIYSV